MAVADRKNHSAGAGGREVKTPDVGKVPEARTESRPVKDHPVKHGDDYNGMSLEEWKAALAKDVEDRFGPRPDDLISAGKAGW